METVNIKHLYRGVFWAVFFIASIMGLFGCTENMTIDKPIIDEEEIDLSKESQIVKDLLGTGLTLLKVETVNGEEPTCEFVSPPEGAMGRGIKILRKFLHV